MKALAQRFEVFIYCLLQIYLFLFFFGTKHADFDKKMTIFVQTKSMIKWNHLL